MIVLIQRVKKAAVIAEKRTVASVKKGLLLLTGVMRDDSERDAVCLAEKIVNLRIFRDLHGKMNLNIYQAQGEILSVSQFTLCADTKKGNRPGFDRAASGAEAAKLWEFFNRELAAKSLVVKKGIFAAEMDVQITNEGPVTILLDSKKI